MDSTCSHFVTALRLFDAAHGEDPSRVMHDGREWPGQLLYAARMSECLPRFCPAASEALRLAAPCQHIRRWMIPRNSYPRTRAGYLQWRTALGKFHAEQAAAILQQAGYASDVIERVSALLRKEKLKDDPEVQTLEDVICLVFLEFYLGDFAREHDEAKVLSILRKTWKKMSERGRAAAMKIELGEMEKSLVQKALAESKESTSPPGDSAES